jgi:transposase-like protein
VSGRGRYERRGEDEVGSRNGYERGRLRTAEGFVDVAVPQVRGAGEAFRSSLMSFLEGNSEVLESLVTEMYARGLSTRDVEDAFRASTGSGPTIRPSSPATCPRSRQSICSPTRYSRRCAGTGRRRRCWLPGASTPRAANT